MSRDFSIWWDGGQGQRDAVPAFCMSAFGLKGDYSSNRGQGHTDVSPHGVAPPMTYPSLVGLQSLPARCSDKFLELYEISFQRLDPLADTFSFSQHEIPGEIPTWSIISKAWKTCVFLESLMVCDLRSMCLMHTRWWLLSSAPHEVYTHIHT